LNAYLDTSVVLRVVLGQPAPLAEWDGLIVGVSSELLRVEAHCALWRSHLQRRITADEYATLRESVDAIIGRLDLLVLTPETLRLAAFPRSKPVNTLDALHLATAILYRDTQPGDEPPILFATHDRELAEAARATNFRVLGA
jgi:predicted nucleic acid-binding protein